MFCILFFLLSPDASTSHYIHLPLHYPENQRPLSSVSSFLIILISCYIYTCFSPFHHLFFRPLCSTFYVFILLCVFLCNTPTTLTITCSLPSFLMDIFSFTPPVSLENNTTLMLILILNVECQTNLLWLYMIYFSPFTSPTPSPAYTRLHTHIYTFLFWFFMDTTGVPFFLTY